MRGIKPGIRPSAAACITGAWLVAVLAGCSTVDRLRGPKEGASTDVEARNVAPEDPLARPIQAGWTSARATHCGFVFKDRKSVV